ncbi:MAG: hypothetical protein HW401_530 [Parcubacteria group bacterium]|nr:hypothetical protein [Parcubacteria group bacterium]
MDSKNNKNKEIENQASYSKLNLKTVSIFQNDTQAVFIFKKTERIASAIYLLTGFISDSEPIKWKMRDVATRLLSYSINLSNQGHRNRADAMSGFTSASFEVISLLAAANISGIFSPMNCEIIKFEIEKIIELVELKERGLNAKFLLSKNFFETSEDYSDTRDKLAQKDASLSERDNKRTAEQNSSRESILEEDSHKGHLSIKDTNSIGNKSMSFNNGHVVKDKNKRYEVIINLLKNVKEISVKDVSSIVTDCSEKTLQRELLGLVDKGVLKKEGERRWSKYSLA